MQSLIYYDNKVKFLRILLINNSQMFATVENLTELNANGQQNIFF